MLWLSDANTVAPSANEVERLGTDGFLLLEDVLDAETVTALARRLDELLTSEGDNAGREFRHLVDPAERGGADYLANLHAKDPLFDACLTSPRVLGVVRSLLGDKVRLHAMNSRNPLAGRGGQALHNHQRLCNTLWLLDDMGADNGPTRVVPGSNRWAEDHEERDWSAPCREQLVTAKAGSVIVLDPRLMHAGTENTSGRPRRVVTTAYSLPDMPPQY